MNSVEVGDPKLSDVSNAEDDIDDDEEGNWQLVGVKRKCSGSPTIYRQKRQHQEDIPSTSNRYDILMRNDDEAVAPESNVGPPKPPPIFIPNVVNIAKMINDISKIIRDTEYNYKSLRDGQVRLNIKNVDTYRKLIKYFDEKHFKYHTFQLKNERSFRAVIKGLHHTTNISDIKAMLLSLGHQVRSVRNIVSRVTKNPLPMFFVDLDPQDNNKEIFDIRSFDNAIIQVEPPKKYDDIVQCFRCQDYGHTKSYCKREFRCVKCGANHPTKECTKTRDGIPNCVHCSGSHTASYKGCLVYQKLLDKRYSRYNSNRNHSTGNNIQSSVPQYYNQTQDGCTYSQAVRGNAAQDNLLEKIEAMLSKQIELTNTLINMMSMLMNKICK